MYRMTQHRLTPGDSENSEYIRKNNLKFLKKSYNLQPDYSRHIVLKLQFDCMKTQGAIALRHSEITTKKKVLRSKLNMFRHNPNIMIHRT